MPQATYESITFNTVKPWVFIVTAIIVPLFTLGAFWGGFEGRMANVERGQEQLKDDQDIGAVKREKIEEAVVRIETSISLIQRDIQYMKERQK